MANADRCWSIVDTAGGKEALEVGGWIRSGKDRLKWTPCLLVSTFNQSGAG